MKNIVNNSKYRYGLVNRPAGIGCIPKYSYEIEPSLTDRDGLNLTRHGIAVFDQQLTESEIYAFELAVIATPDLVEELAIDVALDMSEYAKNYVKMADNNLDNFSNTVNERLKQTRKYRIYVGPMTEFVQMVKARLENIVANQNRQKSR